jgi:hypothetical protein
MPARIEREEEPMAATAAIEYTGIPRRAKYRGAFVLVLAYEGDGRFLVQQPGESPTSIHRDHLKFLRAPMKVVAALDEALEALQAPAGSAVAPRRSK